MGSRISRSCSASSPTSPAVSASQRCQTWRPWASVSAGSTAPAPSEAALSRASSCWRMASTSSSARGCREACIGDRRGQGYSVAGEVCQEAFRRGCTPLGKQRNRCIKAEAMALLPPEETAPGVAACRLPLASASDSGPSSKVAA